MGRIAYVNGRYAPHAHACVHVEDRGYQFADAVYEYFTILGGRIANLDGHLRRLARSLGELAIAPPMSDAALTRVLRELVRRNRLIDGAVYLQVSRGVAPRDHAFPDPRTARSVVATAKSVDLAAADARAALGVAVVTRPDIRWGRCDIKTVGLLPNALAKQAAREAGAYETWLIDDQGYVTEGSSSNAWIVDAEGRLRTRDTQANILGGVTRSVLLEIAKDAGLEISFAPFSVADAKAAREAFMTAASAFVLPIVRIDGVSVGDGRPGPLASRLRRLYLEQARRTAA